MEKIYKIYLFCLCYAFDKTFKMFSRLINKNDMSKITKSIKKWSISDNLYRFVEVWYVLFLHIWIKNIPFVMFCQKYNTSMFTVFVYYLCPLGWFRWFTDGSVLYRFYPYTITQIHRKRNCLTFSIHSLYKNDIHKWWSMYLFWPVPKKMLETGKSIWIRGRGASSTQRW